MKAEQPLIMIDIETLGLAPQSPILSIGLVDVRHPHRSFEVKVAQEWQESYTTIDSDTWIFWEQQPEEVRAKAFGGTVHISDALHSAFAQIPYDALVYSLGADFDLAILKYHARSWGIDLPWKYKNTRCYRTIRAQAKELCLTEEPPEMAHSALSDAIAQAKHLLKIAEYRPFVLR